MALPSVQYVLSSKAHDPYLQHRAFRTDGGIMQHDIGVFRTTLYPFAGGNLRRMSYALANHLP